MTLQQHASLIPRPSARPSWSVCVPYWDQTCLLPIKHKFCAPTRGRHYFDSQNDYALKAIKSADKQQWSWSHKLKFYKYERASKHHSHTFLESDSRVCTLPQAVMGAPTSKMIYHQGPAWAESLALMSVITHGPYLKWTQLLCVIWRYRLWAACPCLSWFAVALSSAWSRFTKHDFCFGTCANL